jgi:CheY-like chemotaxis protein
MSVQAGGMTQPLALVFYERLLPGTQLVNRLQDLNYRVQTVANARDLAATAQECRPMLVLVDLQAADSDVPVAISRLKTNLATTHVPVVAFTGGDAVEAQAVALQAGASFVVQDQALLDHLPQWLEQALHGN